MNRTRRINRARRGGALFSFLLMALPFVWFSGSLAVDYTRVVLAQRQASQIADAAAVAGALQYVPGTIMLNTGAAHSAANSTVQEALTAGVGRQLNHRGTNIMIRQATGPSSPSQVSVTVSYDVEGLVFFGLMDRLSPNSTLVQGATTRHAVVCVPGVNPGTYLGQCARPDL